LPLRLEEYVTDEPSALSEDILEVNVAKVYVLRRDGVERRKKEKKGDFVWALAAMKMRDKLMSGSQAHILPRQSEMGFVEDRPDYFS
jgi:hypothetical protein